MPMILHFRQIDAHLRTIFHNFWLRFSAKCKALALKSMKKKTRLQFRNSRQEVTGLIVNKKLNVPYLFYKNTRAMANQLYKTGHFYIDSSEGTLNQLEGRFSYIDQLIKHNNRLDGEKHNQHLLSARERQYQKFLFYKYFFANPQPLLVTEGKTDEIYLKAAIRSLGREYPALAKLDSTGNYIWKCRFFHRSRRLEYFFDISYDGADAMKNIYNLHTGKNGFPPYFLRSGFLAQGCADFLAQRGIPAVRNSRRRGGSRWREHWGSAPSGRSRPPACASRKGPSDSQICGMPCLGIPRVLKVSAPESRAHFSSKVNSFSKSSVFCIYLSLLIRKAASNACKQTSDAAFIQQVPLCFIRDNGRLLCRQRDHSLVDGVGGAVAPAGNDFVVGGDGQLLAAVLTLGDGHRQGHRCRSGSW